MEASVEVGAITVAYSWAIKFGKSVIIPSTPFRRIFFMAFMLLTVHGITLMPFLCNFLMCFFAEQIIIGRVYVRLEAKGLQILFPGLLIFY